ncbi:VOC family protein [Caballeronia sp. Sq4a]|uniref:VOC family protein n=1 Tax=Caballeronia sp. Sq4a TaxID=2878152 RepID=UPI0020BF3FE1|nr:VOC family protein [Caballeronia sp. Sq4a]
MATPIDDARIVSLSAVTFATHDMARAVGFYQALGFRIVHGGANEAFTSFGLGDSYLNITSETHGPISWWGRIIFYVSDVDAFYRKVKALGIEPQFSPRDAPWNERYFHLTDPDGHELSFARPL